MAAQGTYGRGQMLGSTIDPRLFVQDYSGFANAGAIKGQALSDLGGQIGGAIEKATDMFKERKKIESSVKASRTGIESAIKLGDSLGIDVKSSLQPILQKMDDPSTPLTESALLGDMAAKHITNVLNLGIGAQDRMVKMQQAKAEAAYKAAQLGLSERRTAASEYTARQGATPKLEQKKRTVIIDGQAVETDVDQDQFGNLYQPGTGIKIQNLEKYAADEEGWQGNATPTPTSQVGGSVSDLIANAAKMNIGKLSTASTPGTQGGNVGCADAICRTFKQATGEELVPGGTLSTREMATTLENDPRFAKVSLDEANKGDIILTPRKGNKAGHTGIVLDGGKIASNSSSGFEGKSPGTFAQNYTIGSWKQKIAPRNPSETAVYRYVGSQGIDTALSMGGDMSQQAMGTPEQQAMISSMIEANQGLATAQNIQQGAIPIKPSQISQPVQPTPRRIVRGVLLKPNGQASKEVKVITGEEAKAQNLDPRGEYKASYEDGRITDVQVINAPPTPSEEIKVEASKAEKQKAEDLKDSTLIMIDKFVTPEGKAKDSLGNAVGYLEETGTFISGVTPILGTQSEESKSSQQQLNRLVETSLLEAASKLKPVSNVDLNLLRGNRPQISSPPQVWVDYLVDLRKVLKGERINQNKYTTTPPTPQQQADSDASFLENFRNAE